MFDKIKNTVKGAWNWLSGKKRRIAIAALIISKVFPEYTAAAQIAEIVKQYGEYIFYIFGSADLAELTYDQIKSRLPEGLRKK